MALKVEYRPVIAGSCVYQNMDHRWNWNGMECVLLGFPEPSRSGIRWVYLTWLCRVAAVLKGGRLSSGLKSRVQIQDYLKFSFKYE